MARRRPEPKKPLMEHNPPSVKQTTSGFVSKLIVWLILVAVVVIVILANLPAGNDDNTDSSKSVAENAEQTQESIAEEVIEENIYPAEDAQILARTHLLSREEFKNSGATGVELVDTLPGGCDGCYKFIYTYETDEGTLRATVSTAEDIVIGTVFGKGGAECFTDEDCRPENYEGSLTYSCKVYKCVYQ